MPLRTRTQIARRLRRDATDVERLLWRALRERFPSCNFRRQHPISGRVADFACPACKLVIELDDGQHVEQNAEDDKRTIELARHGYRVIRFWNNEVVENLEGVLGAIRRALEVAPTSPYPLRPGGAERGRQR